MHPTRDTTVVIRLNLAGGRVMPGVSPLRVVEVIKMSNKIGDTTNPASELPPIPITKGKRGTLIEPVTRNKIHFCQFWI